ncbi:hypothetical protein E3P81_02133 [Wallemia ichthyophaga]|nr:hypothetical protein E3P97_02132 [Wallemia ichthyophaga]TIB32782.1 hypothetical protein E3P85_01681 [Wallemia ichthyophaga]TIB46493.1 hypothetical protein E3P82_02130 [Wallemia ichthyophaga]TIB50485.1 hypothetical protein E3P81_02133 [Wallemia ichthyophaga]TIB53502.1 hypothetical protein E3P80_02131 [Wallemia ichthyophaga]
MSINPLIPGVNKKFLLITNIIFTLLFFNLVFLILAVDYDNGRTHVIALTGVVVALWTTVNWFYYELSKTKKTE